LKNKYDVIIVGAGLAGCYLGYLLKKYNYNVVIIEKNDIKTKDKLCGGLLTNKSIEILYDTFLKEDMDELLYKIDSAKVFSKKYININNLNLATVKRKDLDNYILQKYIDLGGEIIDNITIDSIDVNKNQVCFNDNVIEYSYLVGADGVLSLVRKNVFGYKQKMNFALETFVEKQNDDLIINFKDEFKGYIWQIPNKDFVGIGIGDVSGDTDINDKIDMSEYEIIEKERGAFLPTGNDIKLTFNNNIFFIGDAAGLISPITGEGIYYALMSAKLLAFSINGKKDYIKLSKFLIKEIKKHRIIKHLIFNDLFRNFIFSIADKSKFILKIVTNLVKKYLLN
jgi:menaquinone-9 beta-reductase